MTADDVARPEILALALGYCAWCARGLGLDITAALKTWPRGASPLSRGCGA